jgi:hypothetical protein
MIEDNNCNNLARMFEFCLEIGNHQVDMLFYICDALIQELISCEYLFSERADYYLLSFISIAPSNSEVKEKVLNDSLAVGKAIGFLTDRSANLIFKIIEARCGYLKDNHLEKLPGVFSEFRA